MTQNSLLLGLDRCGSHASQSITYVTVIFAAAAAFTPIITHATQM